MLRMMSRSAEITSMCGTDRLQFRSTITKMSKQRESEAIS
jgi:hypothetical protein